MIIKNFILGFLFGICLISLGCTKSPEKKSPIAQVEDKNVSQPQSPTQENSNNDAILLDSPVDSQECGLEQLTIQERIENCSHLSDSKRVSTKGAIWLLVARKVNEDKSLKEVWKDLSNKLLWTGFVGTYNRYDAVDIDYNTGEVIKEIACSNNNPRAVNAKLGIKEIKRLPTRNELAASLDTGIDETLVGKRAIIWSSTQAPGNDKNSAYVLDTAWKEIGMWSNSGYASTYCVGVE